MSRRPRYFTPSQVAAHNVPSDCWVSYLGKVYDLTPLCQEHAGRLDENAPGYLSHTLILTVGDVLLKPITANAGKDISHWFDLETRDVNPSHYWVFYIIFL